MKDETRLALQANVVYLLEDSCGKNQTYIGKAKRHLATRARSIFMETRPIWDIYRPATRATILPLMLSCFVTW